MYDLHTEEREKKTTFVNGNLIETAKKESNTIKCHKTLLDVCQKYQNISLICWHNDLTKEKTKKTMIKWEPMRWTIFKLIFLFKLLFFIRTIRLCMCVHGVSHTTSSSSKSTYTQNLRVDGFWMWFVCQEMIQHRIWWCLNSSGPPSPVFPPFSLFFSKLVIFRPFVFTIWMHIFTVTNLIAAKWNFSVLHLILTLLGNHLTINYLPIS